MQFCSVFLLNCDNHASQGTPRKVLSCAVTVCKFVWTWLTWTKKCKNVSVDLQGGISYLAIMVHVQACIRLPVVLAQLIIRRMTIGHL